MTRPPFTPEKPEYPTGYSALWWFATTVISLAGLFIIVTCGPGVGHA